jgi:hypothetical protein
MSLVKLERLIHEALRILDGDHEGAVDVAREIAAASRTCNHRLQQISFLDSKGDSVQALQLAEDPPAIQDILRLLGFNKANEWKKLCLQKGWPVLEEPDDNMVLLLNSAYLKAEKSKPGHQGLLEAYRGRMLKGDRLAALSLLKAHLRRSPSDEWAKNELKNVTEAEARSLYQKLQKSIGVMDETAVTEQMDVIDRSGLEKPSQEIYQRGNLIRQVYRKRQVESEVSSCLPSIRSWKSGDLWQEAVQYLDDLCQRAREYGSRLPSEGELAEAIRWADTRRLQERKKVQIAELERQVRIGLTRLEEERGRQQKKKRAELIENLADLDRWQRMAVELSHRWESGLEQRLSRESLMLREDEGNLERKAKLAIGTFTIMIAGTLIVTGWLVFKKKSEEGLKNTIGTLMREREVKAAEGFLQQMQGESKNTLIAEKERLTSFIEREKTLCKRVQDKLQKFGQILKETERLWVDEYSMVQQLHKDVSALPRDFQSELQNELDHVENEWQKMAAEEKRKRSDEEKRILEEMESQLEKVEEIQSSARSIVDILQRKLAKLVNQRDEVINPIRSGEEVATSIKRIQKKLEIKVSLIKKVEDCRSKLNTASRNGDVEVFQKALNEVSESVEIPNEIAEKARNAAQLEMNPVILSSRLWMPYASTEKQSKQSQINASYLPSGLALPKEKEAAEKLQGELLDEIYMYQIPDPNRKIYVRGKIQNVKREDQGSLYAFNIFLYDPDASDVIPRFVKTPKIKIGLRLDAPCPVPEPLGDLLVKSKISDFMKSIAENEDYPKASDPVMQIFVDQLFSSDTVDPLGRGYVVCRLKEMCEGGLRPEQFGMTFSPTLQRKFVELGKLPPVEEGEWLLASKRKDPDKVATYKKFFEPNPKHPGYAKEAIFLASLAKQCGVKFVGCVDEEGLFPDLGGGFFMVPSEKGIVIFQKERHGLIPFCPIYKLETEPMIAVQKAAARSGIDFPLAESILQEYVPGVLEGAKP